MAKRNFGTNRPIIIIITLIAAIVIAVGAFGVISWLNDHSSSAGPTKTDNKHPAESVPKDEPKPTQTLSFKTILNTDKQGICSLDMKNSSDTSVLTDRNSTVGKDGQTGCEDWELDTSKLQPGDYEVVVTFTGGGETAISTTTVTVDPQKDANK